MFVFSLSVLNFVKTFSKTKLGTLLRYTELTMRLPIIAVLVLLSSIGKLFFLYFVINAFIYVTVVLTRTLNSMQSNVVEKKFTLFKHKLQKSLSQKGHFRILCDTFVIETVLGVQTC